MPDKISKPKYVTMEVIGTLLTDTLMHSAIDHYLDIEIEQIDCVAPWGVFDKAREELESEEAREVFDLLIVDAMTDNIRIGDRPSIAAVALRLALTFEQSNEIYHDTNMELTAWDEGDRKPLLNFYNTCHPNNPSPSDEEIEEFVALRRKMREVSKPARSVDAYIARLRMPHPFPLIGSGE